MSEMIALWILEIALWILGMLIATPGAFLVALFKGQPKSTAQIMDRHYLLSSLIGVMLWAVAFSAIKFAIMGCVMCK